MALTNRDQVMANAVNLMPNADIETIFSGNPAVVDSVIDNLGTVTVETSSPIAGTRSHNVGNPASENWGYWSMQGEGMANGQFLPTKVVGQVYTASVFVRSTATQTLDLIEYGTTNTEGPAVVCTAGQVKRLWVTFTAGAFVALSVRRPGRVATVTNFVWDQVMISPGPQLFSWFNSGSPGSKSFSDLMYDSEKAQYAGPLALPLSMNDLLVGNGHSKNLMQ